MLEKKREYRIKQGLSYMPLHCSEMRDLDNGHSTPEQAWNDCKRGDWMLWIAKELEVDDRLFTKAKALCANTVRHLMKDKRSTDAIDAAMRYANGEITREELNKYAVAAYNAATAASYDDADDVAYAADAAYSATSASASASATYAAYAVASATSYAADAAAANYQATADICREILTEEVFEKLKNYEQPN
jgi:hypothetical protein